MKSYRNNDKENQGLFQNAQSTIRKFKNFGQQIKSKLKVIETSSKPYQEHRLIKPPALSSYQSRSLKTQPDSNSRSKSVKFAENPTNTLVRKHSTNSILKNSSLKKNNSTQGLRAPLSQRNSLRNSSLKGSMCSSTFNEDDQSCENNISNKVIKEKYEKILQALKRYHRKYTDQIFPPVKVSLDGNLYPKQDLSQIKWVRVTDVFKGKTLKVWNKNSDGKIVSENEKYKNIATSFNCLKNVPKLLQKMFQIQKINEYGIYCVKINQNSFWKNIIIDDFIPVVKNSNDVCSPAYLNYISVGKQVQIWPFLLLKAMSKFYSSYANIPILGELCTLAELMNSSYRKYSIDNESALKKMFQTGKNYHYTMIGKDLGGLYHPLKLTTPNQQNWNQWSMDHSYQDSADNFKTKTLKLREVKLKFSEIYQIIIDQYSYSGINLTRNLKQPIILRSFNIEEFTPFQLSLIQKEKRIHNNSKPQYIWIRVILALKESTGYRWIDGVYANTKHLFLRGTLQMGQYYVLILPEWNDNNYDLSLVYRGNIPSKIQRKMTKDYPKILMEVTMDIAQRYGKLNQINPNICAYNYIQKKMGLIIENINNQRHKGQVKIVRSVEGLTGKFPIEPMNEQFHNRNTIQICIKCMSHYTVVLRLLGGVDDSILNLFDFGS